MGYGDVNCDAECCWYKNNPDRDEYCPSGDTKFVGNNVIARYSNLDISDCTPGTITLCDMCAGDYVDNPYCDICKRKMYDDWISEDVITTINEILGQGTIAPDIEVCRKCVDYEDMDNFESILLSDEPDLDQDLFACGSVHQSKWLETFGEDAPFYTEECPTKDEATVNAKVRKYLARDLVESIEKSRERHRSKKLRKAEETSRRTREVAQTIHEYIPTITEAEAHAMVSSKAKNWIRFFPRQDIRDAISLFKAALDYGQ